MVANMKITLLCSNIKHPINRYLQLWIQEKSAIHEIDLVCEKSQLTSGDFLFLVSCSEIVGTQDRKPYSHCLVLHASDLPMGRGWSPHIWEIAGGAEVITISLLEAEDKVDSGRIWRKKQIQVPKHTTWNEINGLLFSAEIELMDYALTNYPDICPQLQNRDLIPTYYRKRTAEDSKLSVEKSLLSQFDLLRVCDPYRFPAIVEMHGFQYKLTLEKLDDKTD